MVKSSMRLILRMPEVSRLLSTLASRLCESEKLMDMLRPCDGVP